MPNRPQHEFKTQSCWIKIFTLEGLIEKFPEEMILYFTNWKYGLCLTMAKFFWKILKSTVFHRSKNAELSVNLQHSALFYLPKHCLNGILYYKI